MNREIKFKAYYKNKEHIQTGWFMDMYMTDGKLTIGGDIDWVYCQYTGLKDKNGKDIYEGDIVMPVGYNELVKFGVVVYSIERGGFDILLNNVDSMSFDDHDHFYGSDFEKCEIIGNIYENPELLKNE